MQQTNKQPLILIVDDIDNNIQLLGTTLSRNNYNIAVAKNGVEAISKAVKLLPDLILLDIMMPVMDGFETCQKLKELPETNDIPIIFLTAKVQANDIIKGFETGAVDYVTKPFNPTELLARVKTHLDLREKTKRLLELSNLDGLTEIANRRRMDEFLDLEWRRCWRSALPVGMLMLDIDFFKHYNDHYGHLKGDECLKAVASTITAMLQRPSDLVARYGGEEFTVVMGNVDHKQTKTMAQRIHTAIGELKIPHEKSSVSPHLSVSIGCASMVPTEEKNTQTLLDAADKKLYEAKNNGRNQVCD